METALCITTTIFTSQFCFFVVFLFFYEYSITLIKLIITSQWEMARCITTTITSQWEMAHCITTTITSQWEMACSKERFSRT